MDARGEAQQHDASNTIGGPTFRVGLTRHGPMPDQSLPPPALAAHGAAQLTAVIIDTYNAELRSADGFIGDRASNRAFRAILDDWRERIRKVGEDPFGDTPSDEISKRKLDKLMQNGDPEAAGVLHGTIEEFAQELASVIRRFLRLKAWHKTERVLVGGGLRASRIGELAIGRAAVILKADKYEIELKPIHHHPDEAGLVGCAHLAPSWMFKGHDSIAAIDIGGSNIRAGVVELNAKKAPDLSDVTVREFELWRHTDDKPTREAAIKRIGKMLDGLIGKAEKHGLKLAPFIGIGCPGLITPSGAIKRGGQNLPGNWESKKFNLPQRIRELVPRINGHETMIVVHNDAVVQGLSEVPFARDVERWGAMTIGTRAGQRALHQPGTRIARRRGRRIVSGLLTPKVRWRLGRAMNRVAPDAVSTVDPDGVTDGPQSREQRQEGDRRREAGARRHPARLRGGDHPGAAQARSRRGARDAGRDRRHHRGARGSAAPWCSCASRRR